MRELVDRSPSKREITLLWEFFESSCAYCGTHLSPKNKEGHVDHLVAASLGGTNHISNRVLSCANCNEKEKLDQPWEQFLQHKSSNEETFLQRRAKILEWSVYSERRQENELLEAADKAAAKVAACFEEEVAQLRRSTANKRTQSAPNEN
jgi:CRISPR/Cas system Type II protein with McrA/HNH and RuvC-like nuclease domain